MAKKKSTKKAASTRGTDETLGDPMLPSDLAKPSGSADDVTNDEEPDGRPTAREGLKPIGRERPHPTAAARPGKTSGEAGRQAFARATMADAPATDAKAKKAKPIRVEAIALGYYDDTRRRTGDVFDIRSEEDFSERWMRTVDGSTPTRTTTSGEALKREQAALKQLRTPASERKAREENPLDA
jgi:hypothetical protein